MYCNNIYSPFKCITKGVPQGFVLGPILFLIYINDIINASNKLIFLLYADDTTLLLRDSTLDSLHMNITIELDKISKWIYSNKLQLNIKKTDYILFKNRSIQNSIPQLSLDGEVIK